jgi:hypothetical protein
MSAFEPRAALLVSKPVELLLPYPGRDELLDLADDDWERSS